MTLGLKIAVALAVIAAAVLGMVLLSGMLVGLVIGGVTLVAVLYDSATYARHPRCVIVGEIDHDFGSTTQKLHDVGDR